MKIEIEGSREDVMNILKAIAGIPETIIEGVPCVHIEPEEKTVKKEPESLEIPAEEQKNRRSFRNLKNPRGGGSKSLPIEKSQASKSKGGYVINENGGGLKKAIDVFVGSAEKGFSLQESFDSISDAARFVGAKHAANISTYIDSGKVYKGTYKFISRKL